MDTTNLQKKIRSCIKLGDINSLNVLAQGDKSWLTWDTPFGTWLHVAASCGRTEIVDWLLSQGLDINAKAGTAGAGALHSAASNGHVEVVELLIRRGAIMDVTAPERNPLFAAIYGGHASVAEQLIRNGIDIHATYTGDNMSNMNAMAFAKEWGRMAIVDMLKSLK